MTRFRNLRGGPLSPGLYRAINRKVGSAQREWDMIAGGDRILCAVSGGKDSLGLLWILNERRKRVPIRYELFAGHIDPGFPGGSSDKLAAFCRKQGFSLEVEHTTDGPAAHKEENKENPCFYCSRMRKKRLFEMAQRLGCNKIALGHHKDDLIESLFLSMCYAGEMATMRPKQDFFGGEISVIRPLAYVDEADLVRFSKALEFPEFPTGCPTDGKSKRSEVKEVLSVLYARNKKIKGNLFRSMSRVRREYLLDRSLEK
ncbi:MAG: tRNA 2-thiocytidine(32) synthetase TtcA [Deltaproteobacteria bacterium]|nr:tRNA 2-thiocytidine(32) synthetase TtcA [Deltaproteobacteria bacterium]